MTTHTFYEINKPDLRRIDLDLAHACAMMSHTYEAASYAGFCRLTENEQKDYLWAVHVRLKSARKALARIGQRARFDDADLAANAEREPHE